MEKANLAAIEYVVYKYGKQEWFTFQFRYHIHQLFVNKIIFNPPLIIYYQKLEKKMFHEGKHYLIDMMQKCDNFYKKSKWYDVFVFYYLVFVLFLTVYLANLAYK